MFYWSSVELYKCKKKFIQNSSLEIFFSILSRRFRASSGILSELEFENNWNTSQPHDHILAPWAILAIFRPDMYSQ